MNLDAIIRRVATARAYEGRWEIDELFNEAWCHMNDPVRAKWVGHHLANDYQDSTHAMSVGETRLVRMVDKFLDDWERAQDGLPPRDAQRSTYGDGQQSVQVGQHCASLDGEEDETDTPLEQAFPYSDRKFRQGYTIAHVEVDDGDWEREPLRGRYGFAQVFPFGIIDHALDLGIISAYQADLLKHLMDGDSAGDLFCRFPIESYGAVQKAFSVALSALRKEPKIQEWAQSLGFNPLAIKGQGWVSEHRHEDGRPAGPAAARPFTCDCDRTPADWDEDALDRSDPFLRPVTITHRACQRDTLTAA